MPSSLQETDDKRLCPLPHFTKRCHLNSNYPISSTHSNRVRKEKENSLFQIQRVIMHIMRWSMKSTSYHFGQIQLCADFKRKTLMIPFPQAQFLLFFCVCRNRTLFNKNFPYPFENFQNPHFIIFSTTEFAITLV